MPPEVLRPIRLKRPQRPLRPSHDENLPLFTRYREANQWLAILAGDGKSFPTPPGEAS